MKTALNLRSPALLISVALFFAALVLYVFTLAPTVVTLFDDSLEFQLVTYLLGVAHPTGYPLYTMLGKLFTFLPLGDVAYRVNLMSAVFGALAVTLLYLLLLHVDMPRKETQSERPSPAWPTHLGALFGALLLAVGPIFWQQATIAEVYTLNAFFVVLLLLVTVRIPRAHRVAQSVWLLAFLAGLSLTHHRTMVLLFLALGIYLLLTVGFTTLLKPKTWLPAIAFGLLPLLLYLYLPLRGHIGSLDGTYQNTWAGFWQQVSAGGYGVFIFSNPFNSNRDVTFYAQLLANQFYSIVLGLVGLAYLVRFARWKILTLTGVAFLTYFLFNISYNVTDIEVFLIPNFIIWAIWSGLGAIFLLQTAATFKHKSWRLPTSIALVAIFVFMLLQLVQTNFSTITERQSWTVHNYGVDMLQQPLADNPTIIGIVGEMTLLRYFQHTQNLRPDVETIAADLEADRLAAVEKSLADSRVVYLTRELPGAADRWSLGAVGPLIQVRPEPLVDPPEMAVAVNQPVTPEITLLGYTISRPPYTDSGPAPVRLTLFWQTTAPIPTDLKVSARLLTPGGDTQSVVDAVPVHFAYPTTAWRTNEIVTDVYDLNLPVDTPPGQYTPLIILYDPAQNAAEVGRAELLPISN